MKEGKSIEQLENDYWSDIDFPTPLIQKCYAYRRVPIRDLSIGQVRLLLEQKIGVKHILSVALDILKVNIVAEGDFFPGDLLSVVLDLGSEFWLEDQENETRLEKLLQERKGEIMVTGNKELQNKVNAFLCGRRRTTSSV